MGMTFTHKDCPYIVYRLLHINSSSWRNFITECVSQTLKSDQHVSPASPDIHIQLWSGFKQMQ